MARARLLVVSSHRLERLDALLVASGAERRHVVRVDDPFDLFEVQSEDGCTLLLDLDAMPETDAGLLRRWCERHTGAHLVWLGGDNDRAAAFQRAGVVGLRMRWPIDLDDLARLAAPSDAGVSRQSEGPSSAPAATRHDAVEPVAAPEPVASNTPNGTSGSADLHRIEAILGRDPAPKMPPAPPAARPRIAFLPAQDPLGAQPEPQPEPAVIEDAVGRADVPGRLDDLDIPPGPVSRIDALGMDEPLLTKDEIDAFFAPPGPLDPANSTDAVDTLAPTDPGAPPEAATVGASVHAGDVAHRRPTWLKDQTADLADIVQVLDLRARANHAHVGLEGELARLRQFTKTIGFVATPPPPGTQDFDLATLVEEQLGDLAGDTPDAPRLLFRRSPEGTKIRADKLLVAMALEAVLQTAVGCAGAGDVVRVSVDARIDDGPVARVQFPAGPLRGLPPSSILEPYALKSRLPQIGSNALAAAGGIAVGQGGDLVITEASADTLAFEVSFPGTVAAPSTAPSTSGG